MVRQAGNFSIMNMQISKGPREKQHYELIWGLYDLFWPAWNITLYRQVLCMLRLQQYIVNNLSQFIHTVLCIPNFSLSSMCNQTIRFITLIKFKFFASEALMVINNV